MRRAAGFFAGLCVVLFMLSVVNSLRGPRPRTTTPSFVLPDLSGKAVRIEDLRGKVVVVNLWATWCPPCVEEMPTLEKLWLSLKDRDFVLLGVNQDEDPAKVKAWIEERSLTFPVLLDPHGQVGSDFGVTGYPETFVLDRTGRIVHHHVGYRDWAEPRLVAAIERLMTTGEWRL